VQAASPLSVAQARAPFRPGLRRGAGRRQHALAQVLGQRQPETVRDYTLSHRKAAGGPLVGLVKVDGNHQRLHRRRFPAVEAQAVRLHVRATNGDKLVRVFEVRCYA
jgi:hypothetical protein